MTLLLEAVKLTSEPHGPQQKKKPLVAQTPYLGHLIEVAGLLSEGGRTWHSRPFSC